MNRLPALLLVVSSTLLLIPGLPLRLAAQPSSLESETLGDDPVDLRRRAEEAFENDDVESAILLFRRLAETLSGSVEKAQTLVTLAWVQYLGGQLDQVHGTLTEALVLAPDLTFQADLYSDEFGGFFRTAQDRAQRDRQRLTAGLLRRGIDEMRRRNYSGARSSFQEVLAKVPDHPQGLYNLALVDLYDGRSEESLAGFQKLLALHARNPGSVNDRMRSLALVNVGYLHNARGNYVEAEIALERATEVDPDNASAWSNLGVTRRSLSKPGEAAEAFRRAYALNPEDPSVMNNLGLTYIDTQDWVSAAALLREATGRFPDNASLWLNLGRAQVGIGNPTDAVSSFEEAIRSDPGNAGGWAAAAGVELARVYYEAGAYERSLAETRRTLSLQRDHTEAWIYQGLSQKAQGNYDGARSSFEEAIRLDPNRADTHNNLGTVYYEIGLLDDAERAFRRALEIDPAATDAQQNLSAVRQAKATGGGRRPTAAPPPPRSTSSNGSRLGIRFARIDYSAIGIKGAMVESVEPGSAAGRAGLRGSDLILKVDGHEIASSGELESYVRQRPSGAQVTFDLLRNNLPQRIEVTLP